jgi:hypothetical protein
MCAMNDQRINLLVAEFFFLVIGLSVESNVFFEEDLIVTSLACKSIQVFN